MNDFQRVNAGDDIEIRASQWNEFIRSAEYTRTLQKNSPNKATPWESTTIVCVQNASGSALERFAAVGVSGVVCEPNSSDLTADTSLEFINNLVLKIDVPTANDSGKWLVLMQPLQDQEIGYAVGIGVTQIVANIGNVTDTAVDIADGETVPVSGTNGQDILWVAGGVGSATATGEQLMVIRLGGGGSSESRFKVRITSYGAITGNTGRFTYSGKKQEAYVGGQTRDSTTDTATVTPIYNLRENNNDGSGVEGNSADLTNYPSSTNVKPIQGNPVMWCYPDKDCYGATIYYVEYENGMPESCS